MSAQWKVGDLDADLNRLNALLEVICEIQFDLAIGEADRRVDSLLWVAREMSKGVMHHLDAHGFEAAS
ncbi:hypothetical protein [Tianweitania sp.]|uniref:hypothetical protein n=1 Tax=Tianweitania sp. TaxID=2021634 RepID=UPI0028A0BB4C|nr:hypothetical protein [Tianweitania sp.]